MRRTIPILLAALTALAAALPAQEAEKPFSGTFRLGYRFVDTSGSDAKYREDINLEKGLRLFDFSLTYRPTGDLKKIFDRIDVSLTNFGGDPFETFHASLEKFGAYKLRFDRRKSSYFYSDPRLVEGGRLYDRRFLDFDRVQDSGLFEVTLAKPVSVFLSYDRYSRQGQGRSVLDVNQAEFQLDSPVSETLTEAAAGVTLRLDRYSLVLEERIQEFDGANAQTLPGFAAGEPGAASPAALSEFRLDQPFHFRTNVHTARLDARPFAGLILRGTARLSDQTADLDYSESARGVDDLGAGFAYEARGAGRFDRKIGLYNVDATYLMYDKLAVVAAVRSNTFSQDGTLTIGGLPRAADLGFDTLGFEAGLQYQITSGFALTAGYRNEERALTNLETATFADKTLRGGFFGTLRWDVKALKLLFDYQHGDVDDPYTLIAPTRFNRFRATARLQMKDFFASASYLGSRSRNEIAGGVNFRVSYGDDDYADVWTGSNDRFTLRLGYRGPKVEASAGAALLSHKQTSDRLIAFETFWTSPGGTFPWSIAYEGRSGLYDASVSWSATPSLKLGAFAQSYRNRGFWPIDRTMLRATAEYALPGGTSARIAYRFVDFRETDPGAARYKAGIFEFSFGYRWE